MLNKTMIEWLQELPEDYELCLSEYSFLEVKKEDQEEGEDGFYTIVLDKPIIGLIKNDENKEIRFLLKGKDIAIEKGDHIKEIKKMERDEGEF